MKLKNLNKRIKRLAASIAKDTRKLAKLRRKLAAAPKAVPAKSKSKKEDKKPKKAGKTKSAAPVQKKKHRLSPEGRAKLKALMDARWAAKRAADGQSSAPDSAGQGRA
jgi:hypothetical protein